MNRLDAHTIYINSHWPARWEQAEAVAKRFEGWLARLSALDPRFERWVLGGGLAYRAPGSDLTFLVRADATRSDDGEIEPEGGFGFSGGTLTQTDVFSVGFHGNAGANYPGLQWNRAYFHFDWIERDAKVLNFGTFRAATLALIESWEPLICAVRRQGLDLDFDRDGYFATAWMTYVWPGGAGHVDLAQVPVVEHLKNGGLLLSATRDVFDLRNASHVEAAEQISAATRQLNELITAP